MIHIEDYTTWVNNEYSLWKEELLDSITTESKFAEFKTQSQVKRMLGVSDLFLPFLEKLKDESLPWDKLEALDKIGNPTNTVDVNGFQISGIGLRYIYYANKIVNNISNMKNIRVLEIGGGYGGLAANVHVLAKEKKIKIKEYGIFDLPEVQTFQKHYLDTVINMTNHGNGIQKTNFLDSNNVDSFSGNFNYCVSCYALGEFDTPVKHRYIHNVVSQIEHGLIVWNPHLNKDEQGELLLQQYHPNIIISPEEPLTGLYNLEMRF